MSSIKDIEKMTIAQLKEELKKKDLSTDGKKNVLVERLSESILKAQEDDLLNTTVGSEDVVGNDDDILKAADDLLGDATESAPAPAENEKPAEEKEKTDEKKDQNGAENATKPKISAPVDETLDAKLKRAARFGLPVGPEVATDEAKKKRAERFGVPVVSAKGSEADVIAKRKERFGAASAIVKPTDITDEATKEKLIKRAQRFGIPVNADGKTVVEPISTDKLASRAARFGINSQESEFEAKKKARLERFGSQ